MASTLCLGLDISHGFRLTVKSYFQGAKPFFFTILSNSITLIGLAWGYGTRISNFPWEKGLTFF
jgi:hypothetical protein